MIDQCIFRKSLISIRLLGWEMQGIIRNGKKEKCYFFEYYFLREYLLTNFFCDCSIYFESINSKIDYKIHSDNHILHSL